MTKRLVYIVSTIAMLAIISLLYYVNEKVNKVVVVDVIKVFNEFNMKKQLEGKVDVELQKYSDHLDSMNALLEIAKMHKDAKRTEIIDEEIHFTKQEAQRAYEISNKNINEQVWNRLNPLIDEFGKKNNYRIVIGANGMGTVLYNVDDVDRTADLIKFINDKYETGN